MGMIILGVGDYGTANNPGDGLKTFALGSCVALILYNPKTRVAGMAHIALPDSTINSQRAREKPGYFADSGVNRLFRDFVRHGECSRSDLVIKLVGGANVLKAHSAFNIGHKNVAALHKELAKLGLKSASEDVGGNFSRTVAIDVASGEVVINSPGRGSWHI